MKIFPDPTTRQASLTLHSQTGTPAQEHLEVAIFSLTVTMSSHCSSLTVMDLFGAGL